VLDTFGGVETACFNIATRLAKNHEVTVICSKQPGQKKHGTILGVEIFRVGPNIEYSNKGNIFKRLLFLIAAKKMARAQNADIIIGFSFLAYLSAIISSHNTLYSKSSFFRKPACIIVYHETWIGEWIKNKGFFTGLFGELCERIVRYTKPEKIIAVSEFTKKRLIDRKFLSDIVVIPNGIDISEFKKIVLRKGSRKDMNTLCIVSRQIPSKRVIDAVDALKILLDKGMNLKLKIVGVGPESENIKRRVSELGLEKNVDFMGYVKNHDDVKDIIKSSAIICNPSVLEGFGISLIEGCAAGTPYVCSDINVFKEVSMNQTGGLIFRQKDPEDLARKIYLLLKNKRLYEKKLKECKKLITYYDWDGIIKLYEDVIKDLCNKNSYNKK